MIKKQKVINFVKIFVENSNYDDIMLICISHSQFSVYYTTFVMGAAGLPVCVVTEPQINNINPIGNISSIGSDGQVKYLHSPGYLEGIPYVVTNLHSLPYNIIIYSFYTCIEHWFNLNYLYVASCL